MTSRNPTDAEIRAHPAFPRVLAAVRIGVSVFWGGLPVFIAMAIYGVFFGDGAEEVWALSVVGLLAVVNMAAQFSTFRRARGPLSEISEYAEARSRAWRLASRQATPRLVRWIPGA